MAGIRLPKFEKHEMTQEILKSRLHYDPNTGEFTWLNGPRKGKLAGSIDNGALTCVYLDIRLHGRCYPCHRLAFLYMTGSWPKEVVDHIDGDGLNNRWNNLRDVKQYTNILRSRYKNPPETGYTNIYPIRSGLFSVYMRRKGKRVRVGMIEGLDKAIEIRNKLYLEYGEEP